MKFYSEKLNKMFDSEAEVVKAEADAQKEVAAQQLKEKQVKEERAADAKKVNEALAAAREAQKAADKALSDFINKYGYFHTSFTVDDVSARNERDSLMNASLNSFANLLDDFLQ